MVGWYAGIGASLSMHLGSYALAGWSINVMYSSVLFQKDRKLTSRWSAEILNFDQILCLFKSLLLWVLVVLQSSSSYTTSWSTSQEAEHMWYSLSVSNGAVSWFSGLVSSTPLLSFCASVLLCFLCNETIILVSSEIGMIVEFKLSLSSLM